MPDLRTADPTDTAPASLPDSVATSDTWRPASLRRALPSGISDAMADDHQRLLDEIKVRHDAFEQQGQVLRQLGFAHHRADVGTGHEGVVHFERRHARLQRFDERGVDALRHDQAARRRAEIGRAHV